MTTNNYRDLQETVCDTDKEKSLEEYLEETLGEDLTLADPDICPDCIPNNAFVEPDITVHEGVYYDEKECDYVVVFTAPNGVNDIFKVLNFESIDEYIKKHKTNKIDTVLRFGLKKITLEYSKTQQNEFYNIKSKSVDEPLEAVARFDYLSDPTVSSNSPVKIRIKVSKRVIDALPMEESGEEDETIQAGIDKVEIDAIKFYGMMLRMSFGLRVYSSYWNLHHTKSNGFLYKKKDETKSPILPNKIYSSDNNKVTLESVIMDFRAELTELIRDKGYRINIYASSLPWDNKKIEKIRILFDNSDPENLYKIKRISVKPYGCRFRPIHRANKNPDRFKSGFKVFNAMALIANINDIDDDLRAPEPPTWHEFLQKYLVPAVALEYGNETGIVSDQTSALACALDYFDTTAFIQGALGTLEAVFGLLAFESNKAACEATQGKLDSKNDPPEEFDFDRAWTKYYNSGDSFILEIYKRLSNIGDGNSNYGGGQGLYRVINALTFCELTNLIKKLIECLLRGKPFEEVVPLIVNRLMKDLSMRHLGKLLTSLPPDQRAEVTREVSAILGQPAPEPWSDSWAEGGSADVEAASNLEFGTDKSGQIKQTSTKERDELTKKKDEYDPDEAQNMIDEKQQEVDNYTEELRQEEEKRDALGPDPVLVNTQSEDPMQTSYGGSTSIYKSGTDDKLRQAQDDLATLEQEKTHTERNIKAKEQTIADNEDVEGYTFGFVSGQAGTSTQQQLKQMNFDGKMSQVVQKIAGAYIEAFMKVVDPSDLLGYLDKLPVSTVVRNLLAIIFQRAYCPTPTLKAFSDIGQLIPKFKIDICDPTFAIKIPKLPRLPRLIPNFREELFKRVKQKIMELIMKLLLSIVIKIIKLIDDAICKGLNALLEGQNDFLNFLGNSLCDDDDPSKNNRNPQRALDDALRKAGLDPNDRTVNCLSNSVASVMTKREMMSACIGTLNTPGAYDRVARSIQVSCPDLGDMFPNGVAVKSIFDICSDYIPLDIKSAIADQLFDESLQDTLESPTCDLLCLSNQDYNNWNKYREGLLTGQGMPSDQAQEEVDKMNQNTSDALRDALDDIENVQDKIRDAIADLYGAGSGGPKPPGCDQNGLAGGDGDDSNLPATAFNSNKLSEDKSDDEMFVQTIESSFYRQLTGKRKSILGFILSDTNGNVYRYHQFMSNAFIFKDIVYDTQEDADADEFRLAFGVDPQAFFPKTIGAHCRNSLLETFEGEDLAYKNENNINIFTPVESTKKSVDIFSQKDASKKADLKFAYTEDEEYYIETAFINSYNNADGASYKEEEDFGFTVRSRNTDGNDIMINEKFRNSYSGSYFLNLESVNEPFNRAAFKHLFRTKMPFPKGYDLIYNELQTMFFKYATTAILSRDIDLSTNELLPDIDREKVKKKNVSETLEEFDTFSEQSSAGFVFGHKRNNITDEDLIYYNPDGKTEYDHEEDEEILGISANPDKVIFLDPEIYGGKYTKPKIYISPEPQSGWKKVFDAMSKSNRVCDEYVDIVFPFKKYRERLDKLKNVIPFDKRLYEDRSCFPDVPFDTILPPETHAQIDFICRSSLLTYSMSEIVKTLPILTNLHYNKVNYTNVLESIIFKNMKREMFKVIGAAATRDNKYIRRHRHWLIFLEQCAQIFEREVQMKTIEPTEEEKKVLEKILMIKKYYHDPTFDDISKLRKPENLQVSLGEEYRNFTLDEETIKDEFFRLAIGYDENQELCYKASGSQTKDIQKPKRIRINKFKLQTRLFAIRTIENDISILVKSLLNQEIKRFFDVFNKQLEPSIFDLSKYMLSENKMFVGSQLNIGKYQEIKNLSNNFSHNYGDISEVEPNLEGNFIDNLELNDSRLDDIRKHGGFALQKYIRINEKEIPIEQKPVSFTERTVVDKNVTTLQNVKNILSKEDIDKEKNLSDYFGNLRVENDELTGESPLHMGVRILYICSEGLLKKFQNIEEFDNFLELQPTINREKAIYMGKSDHGDNFSFQFPVISYEIPLKDQKISEFLEKSSHYDIECLIKNLTKQEEYKILFHHIFSVKGVSSAVLAQTHSTFINSIGYNDGWALDGIGIGRDPENRISDYETILKGTKKLLRSNLSTLVKLRDEDLEKDSRKDASMSLLGFLKDLVPKYDFKAELKWPYFRRIVTELDDCDERLLDQFFPDEE